jgi:hypothetical protein
MSTLLDLQMELQETNEAVARAERTLGQHPNLPSVQATLRAIVQRRERLQEEFVVIAQASGRDVCRYWIETTEPNPSILNITDVLGSFQKMFTAVYDAITNAPKQIASWGSEASAATRLGFAYTVPGSIGIVMVVDESRELLPDRKLDEAITGVFEMMSARRPEQILDLSTRFGLAAVRVTREWAAENAKAGFGANVEWRRKDDVQQRVRLQTPEIIQLESAIDRASHRQTEKFVGELVEVNVEEHTFRMRLDLENVISGTYADAITPDRPASVPHHYEATMEVTRRILTQGAEDSVSYFLIRLDEPDGSEG